MSDDITDLWEHAAFAEALDEWRKVREKVRDTVRGALIEQYPLCMSDELRDAYDCAARVLREAGAK